MKCRTVIILVFMSACLLLTAHAQYPYARRISLPEQLPTQVVYDMLTDSKGYIWLATDKGLFRFNGRTFVSLPFVNTSSKAVSYLQEDDSGMIWCMNFYNQVFYCQKDTLRKFDIDYSTLKRASSFNNMVVGHKQVWLQSFMGIYELDKSTSKLIQTIPPPGLDPVISSAINGGVYYALSQRGFLYSDKEKKWKNIGQEYYGAKLVEQRSGLVALSTGNDTRPGFEISGRSQRMLPAISLNKEAIIFHGVCIDSNEYWLCTQKGAFRWDKETGSTVCYFPNERVSDIVKDYQGNYWFSTLDNGVFVAPSMDNILLKIYKDAGLDNFTRVQKLPDGEIVTGNIQGMMARVNLQTQQRFDYKLATSREIEFINYDTLSDVIISNRGVFKQNETNPVELVDYGKGVQRDKFGNMLVAIFSNSFVMDSRFGAKDPNRLPEKSCPLYQKEWEKILFEGKHWAYMFRLRRGLSVLASRNKDCFWIGYEDELYEYHYDGSIYQLKDSDGKPVIAKSLQQQADGSLVVGTSTKGVMIFSDRKPIQAFTEKDGLSSPYIRKVWVEDRQIWVLTEVGLDRIDPVKGIIANRLDEYGLSNTIINDFVLDKDKIIIATTSGILAISNLPKVVSPQIKFPLLKAVSDGVEVTDNTTLTGSKGDISFSFEALHYLSGTALVYQYRLKGLDTVWHAAGKFTNQLTFNRLSPGRYTFEIKAVAGANYTSVTKTITFTVPRPFWQKTGFVILVLLLLSLLFWTLLLQWKKNLLRRQTIKEQLLKSQLVALRAQMNPHFLYNVLNTVQGLVYSNRKTEAGELLGNFSDLMRRTLQVSDKQLLPLSEEIDNLRLYLELEKARFEEGFSFQIEVAGIEDMSEVYIPSLMLQPFAENAVKHGLMHKQGDKNLLIHFEKRADGIQVVIDDNGIGRARSMEINQRTTGKPFSFATAALTERIALFNNLYRQKITWSIIDKTDENRQASGTRIELFIPDYDRDPQAS